MSNNKQNSVEWLFERINLFCMFTDGIPDEWLEALEQAKQMEKQQKIEFARHCLEKANRTFDLDILTSFIDVHQYYNEEYGSKESDKCCTPPGQIKRYIDCIGCDKNPKNNIKDYGKE